MTMRKLFCFAVTAFLILSIPASAFADTVQGRVANVSSSALDMTVYDAQGRAYPNKLHLKVDGRTRVSGVPSVVSFRRQDPVSTIVRQENTGVWRADSITLLQETAKVQSAPPSASFMDALGSPTGQKVIRGGITGAITGAVASGASGGKAGKGALVGAGVGAGVGLLEGLFSQPQPTPVPQQQVYVARQDDRKY